MAAIPMRQVTARDRVEATIPRTGGEMAVVKIIELVGSSTTSSDDAVKAALKDAQATLRNIKAVDVVSVGLRGDGLEEWRAHVRVAFLIERVSE
jgi:flavin-binding protein dodecin